VTLTWLTLQRAHGPDAFVHAVRVQALGLICPDDVFEQLFHEQHENAVLAAILRWVDWTAVKWEERDLSGVAWRQVGVPRAYQHAMDEARNATAESGFFDDRPEVMAHWERHRTWIRAPVVLSGELLQSALGYELIVGFTRLGNLLGALDRGLLPESALHRVWIGSSA
jgi:hypothetical protein